MAQAWPFDARMLVDGMLVEAESGATFDDVNPATEEEDATHIANDGGDGLAGGVMSGSLERSIAVARRIRSGAVGVNGFEQYIEVKAMAWPAAAAS